MQSQDWPGDTGRNSTSGFARWPTRVQRWYSFTIFQRFYFMTVFNDLMTAEAKADQAIKSAEEGAAIALTEARNKAKQRLVDEELILKTAEEKTLKAQEIEVAAKVKKIENEAETEVLAVRQRFTAKRADLKTMLLGRF